MNNQHSSYVSTMPLTVLEDRKSAYRARLEQQARFFAGAGGLTEADRAGVIPVVMQLQGLIMHVGRDVQDETEKAIAQLKSLASAGLERERAAAAAGDPSAEWRQQKYAELGAYLALASLQTKGDAANGRVAFQLGLFMTRWICDRAPAEDLAILHGA